MQELRRPVEDLDPSSYEVPLYGSLLDVPLLLGGPPVLVLTNAASAILFVFGVLFVVRSISWWMAAILLIPMLIHRFIGFMAEDDPRFHTVWLRYRRLRGYYPARGHVGAPPARPASGMDRL